MIVNFDMVLGIVVYILVALVLLNFLLNFLRKRMKSLDERMAAMTLNKRIPDRVKWWFMFILTIPCLCLVAYCLNCQGGGPPVENRTYFEWVSMTLIETLPWFVIGCILAGLVLKYIALGKLRLPKSMLGAGVFAALIPICSCAAVPMAHGLMLTGKMRVRTVITFLIVVPVLSPVVMSLAVTQIGWEYLLVEIIAVFTLAMVTGIIIERFVGIKKEGSGGACFSCKGCASAHIHEARDSALLAGWDQLTYLLKYILLGIIIGALISMFVQPSHLSDWFGREADVFGSIPGLVLIVLLGIPIFMCSGQDVLMLAPLLDIGLPLGHAIAFAISGNAICLTSAPVLNATFGRRVTIIIFGSFFLGSIMLGLIINGVVYLI